MEETVYLKKSKTHSNSKHFVYHVYIFHVPFLHAKTSEVEIGEDSEGFSLGAGTVSC